MSKWDEVRVAFLRDFYSQGYSAKIIATLMEKQFDEPYTRNSVIGKCGRLGLVTKSTTKLAKAKTTKDQTRAQYIASPRPQPPRPVIRKAPKDFPALVPIKRLPEGRECKWPYGEPQSPDYRVCGRPSLDQRPYCEYHTEVATGISYAKARKPTSFNIRAKNQR